MTVRGQRHALAALYPGERTPGTDWTGGWMEPRVGLDTEAIGKTLCQGSIPVRPVVQYVDTVLTELPWLLELKMRR
jgi:hypothetical protein